MGSKHRHPIVETPSVTYDFRIGYVYAAELTNGTVKIGFTRSPRNRARTLSNMTRRTFGADVAKFLCSAGMNARTALQSERRALTLFRQSFTSVGRRFGEFFEGADFGIACALIGAPEPADTTQTA